MDRAALDGPRSCPASAGVLLCLHAMASERDRRAESDA
jgi:hypothetical protein